MLLKWYQDRGLFGFRLSSHIARMDPAICEVDNILPIGINLVFAQMKAAGARKARSL
jgi:hypothetical protein